MSDPLLTTLTPGPSAPSPAVARALLMGLAPPRDAGPAPPWLRPEQRESLARVLAALRRHQAALLAEPVGSGKTYVALAAAASWNRDRATICLVPAALTEQWRRVAARLGIAVLVHSLERVSRGQLPTGPGGLVLIDESHRLRTPSTRRYRHLAPWLSGRPALLLSATPVVNRSRDLAYQLLLAARDDALSRYGMPSLLRCLSAGAGTPALGRLVIQRGGPLVGKPLRVESGMAPAGDWLSAAIPLLDELRLSRILPVAALLRTACWWAAASSPAALLATLRRYRGLLLQARDAEAAGRPQDRAGLRRCLGGAEEQLLLWELLPEEPTNLDLDFGDLPRVLRLLDLLRPRARQADEKAATLLALLADGHRTLVFSNSRETVRYLRELLPAVAWCTGTAAGIGAVRMARESVLSWFRPDSAGRGAVDTPAGSGPPHLVTTDVAAEGLDLHAAARVVHYDLPWNQVRLDQRDGRALRLGSPHGAVEVVRLDPPPLLAARLALTERIASKRSLPARLGLEAEGRRLWRWQEDLLSEAGESRGARGMAVVETDPQGMVAGFVLSRPGPAGRSAEIVRVGWLASDGSWSEDGAQVEPRLREALENRCDSALSPAERVAALAALLPVARKILREANTTPWRREPASLEARRLLRRLTVMVRSAVGRRDAAALANLERAMRFFGGGHTAGEQQLLAELVGLTDRELGHRLSSLPPPTPDLDGWIPELLGVIVFRKRVASPAESSTHR